MENNTPDLTEKEIKPPGRLTKGSGEKTQKTQVPPEEEVKQVHIIAPHLKEIKEKIDFLNENIDISIKKFDSKQKNNAKLGFVVKFLALGLSAVVTILLGLNLNPPEFYNRIALVVSALTGVVSGVSAFFDFNDLSIKYKDTFDKLEVLKVKLKYTNLGIDNVTIEEIEALKDEYIQILKETHQFFQNVKKEESDQTGKKTV